MDNPHSITTGSDGALWFTNTGNTSIGRITTNGVVSNYTGPGITGPYGITTGPDGALWFTNIGQHSIGRITTSGVVTDFTGTGIAWPWDITAGPDGALWFTNYRNNSIGRITTSGVVTNYTGTGIDMPEGITTGPDGALWFTNTGNSSIGRITTSGVVTNYTSGSVTDPTSITAGPDGALWFTNGDSIGRITAVPSASVSPSSGSPGSPVAVSGSGYTPGEQIDVTYETGLSSPAALAICSATAEPNGTSVARETSPLQIWLHRKTQNRSAGDDLIGDGEGHLHAYLIVLLTERPDVMHTKRRALAALACFAGIAFGIPGGVQTPAHHSAGDRVSVAKVTTAPNFEIRRQTKAIQESSNWSGYS